MCDYGATAFPTQLAVTCGFCCGTSDVNWFCKSCPGSLCNTCKQSHPSFPVFKNHIVVPRTNDVLRLYGPSKLAEQCRLHPEKEISTYCKDCQEPCCVTCLVQKHQKHIISTIEDAYLSAENRLNDNVKELEKDVIPTIDQMADKTEKDRSEKRVQIDRVREEVNTFRKELKEAVDESCDCLIEKLEHDETELDNLITKLNVQKGKIRELIKEVNEIIQKGDLSMIQYSPPSPCTFIPEVPTPRSTIPVFSPGRDILSIIKDRIGTVEWIEINSESKRTPISTAKFDPSMININKVGSFSSEIDVTSITTAGNNTAWVMFVSSDTMYLYDSSGGMVGSITVKGSNGINCMVITRSGEIIVTCKDRKVRRVSVSGEVSTLIDTSPFEPTGVCLTDSEDVVVCMRDQDEKNNHIAVYSPDTGRKLREIRGMDGQGNQQITVPHRVVSNGKDLYVVNWDPGHVVCVDERGDVGWVYNRKEAKLTGSFDPCGVSVDKYNNLLVTDIHNNCVHYIDREGRLIQIILTREQTGLEGHWGICVDDKTGQVWVGDGLVYFWTESKKVVICKYLT
ncbi:hypothetical protein FSP39_023332 [Pinctada imbricata]|uniref:B box-type domain-containing protein n=1 Tax=Pinctada imbricata TaxID=66713 RepID=A0AA88YBI4_PINIB|nr:hypothetical protein FSP39_023332 [Pinctada imbricata]